VSVVVIATVRPMPQHRDTVLAAFERAVARVHEEDAGCELYALHRNDAELVMVEKWASRELLAQHSRSAAVAELDAAVAGRVAVPTEVRIYEAVPAGLPKMGAL
jgi:quinol monooxygenase YgiN